MAENTELPEFNEEPLDIVETRPLKRITLRGIFASFLDAFNIERGGVYTLKALFRNPGAAVKDYLGSNRFHYTPPFRILVISTAMILFVINFTAAAESFNTGFKAGAGSAEEAEKAWERIQILRPYLNLILWSLLPFYALVTLLLNRKKDFNFAEHLVFHTYLFCMSNIVSLVILLDHLIDPSIILGLIILVAFFYLIFGYKVFTGRSWSRSILDSILTYFLGGTFWTIFLVFVIAAIAAYSKIFGS